MSELKQICIHFLSGNCKYGNTCTKIHTSPSTELIQEIEKKGPIICNYYPNCKFTSSECKKIHINLENKYEKEMSEFKKLYLNIVQYDTIDELKIRQIDNIKFMIKHDLELLRNTWSCF